MINVFILRGGLFGWDGPVTSFGMDQLGDMIKNQIPDTTVSIYNWSDYESCAADMNKSGGKRVLIGYSGGGSRGVWLLNSSVFLLDLFIAYDPSPTWQMVRINASVKKAICYHNNWPLMFGLGGGQLTGTCPIETHQISEQHLWVQFDQSLHKITLDAIRNLT